MLHPHERKKVADLIRELRNVIPPEKRFLTIREANRAIRSHARSYAQTLVRLRE